MNELSFSITFHGPFHIASGASRDGITAVDSDEPVPATSLKGVMRASAKRLLGTNSELVEAVFGSGRAPAPWRWSPAAPCDEEWAGPQRAARVSIDPTTNAARPDMLAFSELYQATQATFHVTQNGDLSAEDRALHRIVLAVSGQAIQSIGALRRRGLGWVSIRCTSFEPGPDDVRRFLKQRSHEEAS